jgi:RND superfamily putative drug exporter
MTLSARWLGFVRRHPRIVLGGWIAFFALGATGAGLLKQNLKVGGFNIPGTQFHEASRVLGRDFGIASDKLLLAVFHSAPDSKLKVTDVAYHDAVEAALGRLKRHKTVEKVESFYNTGIPDLVSADNRVTYALVSLKGTEEILERSTPEYRALASTGSDQVLVDLTGQPLANFDIELLSSSDVAHVDVFTFPLVFIVLTLLLGSWFAGMLPLVVGIAAVVLSLGGVFVLTQFTSVSVFAMNIATMIGLGLSVDFSLMLICRYQEELEKGATDRDAVLAYSLDRSGKSVFLSGFTLFTTVSILTLFPILIIRSIAQAILISTGAGLVVFFFLLPPLLLRFGHRLKPRKRAEGGTSFWLKLTGFSIRRPVFAALFCLVVLGLLAAPARQMRKIGTTLDGVPAHVESRHALDVLKSAFGEGAPAPLLLVLHTGQRDGIWNREVLRLIHSVYEELRLDPRVDKIQSLMSIVPNPSEHWAQTLSKEGIASIEDLKRIASRFVRLDESTQSTYLMIYSRTNETSPETIELLESIRAKIPEWERVAQGLHIDLGGTPAQHYDFDQAVYREAPPLVAASLMVTLFVLLVFFRSVFLPVKAVIMNLLSLGASFGVMVAVFQYGYGARLLGFSSLHGVQIYTPVLLFSILFGLSTDYEVFVLSRVREFKNEGHTTAQAALLGIEKSSRVIGAAATVMVIVFFSFAFSSVVAVKEIGFSLAVAVLIDATIVRMMLVPATLAMMESLNWWIPAFIAGILPEVSE